MGAVKFVEGSDDRIEGLAIPYGGPNNGKDLDGEAFHKGTDFALDWYPTRPLIMQHGKNPTFGLRKVGEVVAVKGVEDGAWVEAIINSAEKYKSQIKQLVKQGYLQFSSGSSSYLTAKSEGGKD